MFKLILFSVICAINYPKISFGHETIQSTFAGRVIIIEPISEPVSFGEGPHWSDTLQCLYFVDIDAGLVLKYSEGNYNLTRIFIPPGNNPVTFVIPTQVDDKTLVVSRKREVIEISLDEFDIATVTRSVSSVENDKPDNRFNEGRADINGRLFAGTVGPEGPNGEIPTGGLGSFYRLDQNNSFSTLRSDVDISNGIAWNLDYSKMFYIDTGTVAVDVYDYDLSTGVPTNRRVFFDFVQNNITGVPDSMSIDEDGRLWIACYGGSQVIAVNSSNAELVGSIQFPVNLVTSAVFGGPNFDVLYVTTSRHLLTEEQINQQPSAGKLFKITGLGIRGLPANRVSLPPPFQK